MKALVLTAMMFSSSAFATAYLAKPETGQVVFKATALGLRFEGKGQGVDGLIDTNGGVKGTLEFELATLDTGIGMRNAHMKEKYLEVDKYPKSELTITRVAGFDPSALEQETEFEGLLKIRDKQKPVRGGRVKLTKTEGGYKVAASFDTKISDFDIPVPKYAGVVVKDDLHVEADLTLNAKTK